MLKQSQAHLKLTQPFNDGSTGFVLKILPNISFVTFIFDFDTVKNTLGVLRKIAEVFLQRFILMWSHRFSFFWSVNHIQPAETLYLTETLCIVFCLVLEIKSESFLKNHRNIFPRIHFDGLSPVLRAFEGTSCTVPHQTSAISRAWWCRRFQVWKSSNPKIVHNGIRYAHTIISLNSQNRDRRFQVGKIMENDEIKLLINCRRFKMTHRLMRHSLKGVWPIETTRTSL